MLTVTFLKKERPVLCLPNSFIFEAVLDLLIKFSKHFTYSIETLLKWEQSSILTAGLEQAEKIKKINNNKNRINIFLI